MQIVKKKWGREEWIVNSVNPPYCGKRLFVTKGYRVSFHKHKDKDEVFYLSDGRVLMTTDGRIERTTAIKHENAFDTFDVEQLDGEQQWMMEVGDSTHIYPGTYHSFAGFEGAEIYEFSSHHDNNDTYRKDVSGKADFSEYLKKVGKT